ncbi:MAG: P-loop NTPase fold protein [Paenibacillus dendritiformis]|uniref:P-loop NTPase fold protein n=1 Tax=uncultured Paenibacillus sp. TaxID=227322 RepID=UPI0025D75439|nr:P-loop NTPase fold protein [uncultured Paenibacillus sp.]MDU5143711.1 P-loop NTPase fold protein [Paenibacillus dendritiformis]
MPDTNDKREFMKINHYLLGKLFLFGVLLAELALGGIEVIVGFYSSSIHHQQEAWFWMIGALYLLILAACLVKRKRQLWRDASAIIRSGRYDLLLVFAAGILSMFFVGGIGIGDLRNWVAALAWPHMAVLFSLPLVFCAAVAVRERQMNRMTRVYRDSSFISDKEGRGRHDDAFEFSEMAVRFAERVYNQGSPESLVFGIDAPWGTGKSTFVNLCKEHWDNHYHDKIIVYMFDPLRFENSDNLLEKFTDGLLKAIQENLFAPELESLMAKYVKLLHDSNLSLSIMGFRFGLPFDKSSIEKTFDRLGMVLRSIDKKIVIVVDDLDRLTFSHIKEILFVVKKSFLLPNLSYVLCYDTENLTALEHQKLDTEKINEFLEKFINVKTSLYIDHKLLLKYFTENTDKSLARNLLSNPELVAKAVEGLKDIFHSKEYDLYIPFVGDARKLKRLINTMLLLEVEQLDFSNSDFDKHDLIHLLIIYIHYPNIFRKIYNTEVQGKRGFFSLVRKYDDDYPTDDDSHSEEDVYKNSTKYTAFLEGLTEPQRFILNKVFDAKQRLGSGRTVSQEQFTSYACFNGSKWSPGGRNLEQYLNLIIKVSRPAHTEQYKFYVNLKNEMLYRISITQVMQREEFSFSSGEANHEKIWRILINSPHSEYMPDKAKEIISYALESLPLYSSLDIPKLNVGFRSFTLLFFIAKLLDKIGWTDEDGQHWNNSDSHVVQIAEWIFGEKRYRQNGILNTLGKRERGLLGLRDLLIFRLCCCADRGGDMFNLSRALSIHGGPNNPTEGSVNDIVIGEMREISQYIFQVFKSRYIDKQINLFDEVLGLGAEEICGRSYGYLASQMTAADLRHKIQSWKAKMLNFIIYQLGSTIYSSGIPCGYYNMQGDRDGQGINKAMNSYLFHTCFDPKVNEKGFDYFIYYLFINFETTLGHTKQRVPRLEGFIKVLDRERLRNYWRKHRDRIKEREWKREDKLIIGEHEASYTRDLEDTYKVLDDLLEQEERPANEHET